MKLVQLAGSYFLGTEDFISSNSMRATVVLKEKINSKKLVQSYRELILENRLLQTKIIECPEKNKFEWGRFAPEELEQLLSFEDRRLIKQYDKDTLLREYYPTNTRLPLNISVVDEYTVVICMNHIVANGKCLVFWIQKWLQYYEENKPKSIDKQIKNTDFWHGISCRIKRLIAFLWLPIFLTDFICKAGKNAGKDVVDLSYGKTPEKSNNYATKSYSFSGADTKKILTLCKTKKMTLTESICEMLIKGLFQHVPDKKRIVISIPMDIYSLSPYSPENAYGNLIASLPTQFFQGKEIDKQVKSVFRWFKRGLPYSLSCLAATVSISYGKVKRQWLEQSKKPISERSPLGDFSLTYSNLGVISYPVMERLVDSIYFSFKSQSILLVSSTLSGKLYMKVSLSKDLYDADEVFKLFDQILSIEYLQNSK
jgi:hypothetical protein